jgi:hypothetical protein
MHLTVVIPKYRKIGLQWYSKASTKLFYATGLLKEWKDQHTHRELDMYYNSSPRLQQFCLNDSKAKKCTNPYATCDPLLTMTSRYTVDLVQRAFLYIACVSKTRNDTACSENTGYLTFCTL